jgi:hypothetical protein
MGLSNLDIANIQKEIVTATTALAAARKVLPSLNTQASAKQESANNVKLLWADWNDYKAAPYETERSWLDGNTANPILMSQIEDAAQRTTSNIFFPSGWSNSNAMLTPSGNGNSFTTNTHSEANAISVMTSLYDILVNGQSSSVFGDELYAPYSPGATTITVKNGGQTVGDYLYITGGGTSAMVKVTSIQASGFNFNLGIVEYIEPTGTIPYNSAVISNIPGFSNSERTTLTSSSYQNILTGLTGQLSYWADIWNTALSNQLTQLNINIDSPTEISTAKTNVQTAQANYSVWEAYPNTGAGGKFTDTGLNKLTTSYNARSSEISGRVAEIVAALGSVTQDPLGNYSGVGVYYSRFKALNMLVNGADGAMYEAHGAVTAQSLFESKIANAIDRISMFQGVLG